METESRETQLGRSAQNKSLEPIMANKEFYLQKIEEIKSKATEIQKEEIEQELTDHRQINICIRSRPLLDYEVEQGFFDVTFANSPEFTFLEPRLNLKKQPVIDAKPYRVDHAFGPADDNDKVYQAVGIELVDMALKGGLAVVFAYGQTGSGKTFTMQGIQQRVAVDLFQR